MQREKKGHFILIKGTIHQEDITVLNTDTVSTDVPNFIKNISNTKSQMNNIIVIMSGSNTSSHQQTGHSNKK